jgi:hypothetical protein
MMNLQKSEKYFPFDIQISKPMWDKMQLDLINLGLTSRTKIPLIFFYRQVANRLNQLPERSTRPVKAGNVNLYALLTRVFRYLLQRYTKDKFPGLLDNILNSAGLGYSSRKYWTTCIFVEQFPEQHSRNCGRYLAADDQQGQKDSYRVLLLLLTKKPLQGGTCLFWRLSRCNFF